MNDADSKIEEIKKRFCTQHILWSERPFEGNSDMSYLLRFLTEKDQEIERLNQRLLNICRAAGEAIRCPPSPIDAFRMLKARIDILEKGLREIANNGVLGGTWAAEKAQQILSGHES